MHPKPIPRLHPSIFEEALQLPSNEQGKASKCMALVMPLDCDGGLGGKAPYIINSEVSVILS